MMLPLYPAILWTTFVLCSEPPPLIVAHRGASYEAPENTLPAILLAWEQGAHAAEVDVHLTRDGLVVCYHDADTEKLTGKKVVIAEATYAELQELDVGRHKGPSFEDTRIPTLSEILATVPDQGKLYVEIKPNVDMVPALLKVVQESGLRNDQVVLISSHAPVLQKLKTLSPDHKVYWLSKIKHYSNGRIHPTFQQVIRTLREIGADGFSSSQKLRNQDYIKAIQRKGFEFHVWTVNDLKTAAWFRDVGATSITTKTPTLLLKEFDRPVTFP